MARSPVCRRIAIASPLRDLLVGGTSLIAATIVAGPVSFPSTRPYVISNGKCLQMLVSMSRCSIDDVDFCCGDYTGGTRAVGGAAA